MLDSVGKSPQGKYLSMRDGLSPRGPIYQDAWEIGNLRDPSPIVLTLKFDSELHDRQSTIGLYGRAMTLSKPAKSRSCDAQAVTRWWGARGMEEGRPTRSEVWRPGVRIL